LEVPALTSPVIELPKVTGTCPELLAAALRRAVRGGGSWQEQASRVVTALRGRLQRPDHLIAGLLTPEQLAGDPAGYRTHLVHAEPDGSFSVVAMVWLPGQATTIHDHLSWCCTAVLAGTEYEEIYAVREDHLEVIGRNANPLGTVSGFAPPGDVHRVRNIGATTAVSLHVYGTDISRVGSSVRRTYDLPVR
jgi:predicted metal-dependent enzyme (double-stranded beta helix superfamily)